MIFSGLMMAFKANKIVGMLIKNWPIVLLVIVCLGVWWYHTDRTKTIEQLRENVKTLEMNLANCDAAVNNQNAAIEGLSVAGEQALSKVTAESSAKVMKLQNSLNIALDTLRIQPLAETCDAAMDEMIEKAQGELKWVE